MAGIYNRDNINYGSMLIAALKDRAETAARKAAYQERQGKLWGDTVKNVGNMFGRGIMASADSYGGDSATTVDEDKAELKQLEEMQKQQEEIEKQREEAAKEMMGYNPNSVSPEATRAAELMKGYVPAEANPYTRGSLIYEPNYADVAQQNSVPLGYRPTYGIMEDYIPNEEREYNPYSISMNGYYRRGR